MPEIPTVPEYPAVDSVGTRVLGVSAFNHSISHEPFHLPLTPGLNVMYGLNGCGKSRTLRALGGLFGHHDAQQSSGLHLQIAVDPDNTLIEAWEPRNSNLLGELATALVASFTQRVEGWERHDYQDQVELHDPDNDVSNQARLGGLMEAIALEAKLPPPVARALAAAGRIIIRPRSDQGADAYLGLELRDPNLADLISMARVGLPDDINACKPLGLQGATRCSWDWFADTGTPDWLERLNGFRHHLLEERTRELVQDSSLSPAEILQQHSRIATAITSVDSLAVMYVLSKTIDEKADALLPPAWAAAPLLPIGVIYRDRRAWKEDFRVIAAEAGEVEKALDLLETDLRSALVIHSEREGSGLFVPHGKTISLEPSLQRLIDSVGQSASEIMTEVMGPNAPTLLVRVSADAGLRSGSPVRLVAEDYSMFDEVDVRALSDSQRRWAYIALRLAFSEVFGVDPVDPPWEHTPLLLLLDEPDASLHLLARRSLASGLSRLVNRLQVPAVVATHGTELIDQPGACLWHVRRTDTRTSIRLTTPAGLTQMSPEALGLSRSDVVLMTRAWLVVEGEHDRAVLTSWVGEELRAARVRLLAMRGTHNLRSVLDSQLLFEGTDAIVAVLVDNSTSQLVEAVNECMSQLREPGRRKEVFDRLAALHRQQRAGTEGADLVDLARAAAKAGVSGRLVLAGLSKPDIIEYLPAEEFVPGKTWAELVSEWKRSRRDQPKNDGFKAWLRKHYGVRIDAEQLGEVAGRMDTIPTEVTRLLERLAGPGLSAR